MNLEDFVKLWNVRADHMKLHNHTLNWMCDEIGEATFKAYDVLKKPESKTGLRISGLGKPAFIQAMNKLSLEPVNTHNLRSMYHLLNGHVWEAIIIALMYDYGVDVHSMQKEVEYQSVLGHIDAIINDDTVLDIKTMSASYYKKFVETPDDDRGYITQILCYREALGLDVAAILCLNKWFGEMSLMYISDDTEIIKGQELCKAHHCLDRADRVIEAVNAIHEVEDLRKLPLPVAENHYTGSYLVCPEDLKYDTRKHLFWKLNSSNVVKDCYNIDNVMETIYDIYEL